MRLGRWSVPAVGFVIAVNSSHFLRYFGDFLGKGGFGWKIFCSNLVYFPDIYGMETITFDSPVTKPCPFCAEPIQVRAVKCRFCGEFLNTNKAKALQAENEADSESGEDSEASDGILFAGRPSLWGMAGAFIKGGIILVLAGFLMYYPVEELSIFRSGQDFVGNEYSPQQPGIFALSEQQAGFFGKWRAIVGFWLGVVVVLVLLLKAVRLKMIYYEVSADRIEWSRGILNRRVDNIDMFRVIDLKMRRSLLDCILGVGTVRLITTDKTDPEFNFEKIRHSRDLYDIIKTASLDADRRSGVIHLE